MRTCALKKKEFHKSRLNTVVKNKKENVRERDEKNTKWEEKYTAQYYLTS